MIDHVSLNVSNLEKATNFYKKALAPLGYALLMEFPGVAGFGAGGKPDLWLAVSKTPISPIHIAFATDRTAVNGFHAAAVAAGGKDNGPPGLRTMYHPNYYGAFVHDPDGNNVEAVSHAPEAAPKKKATAKKAAPKKAAAKKAAPKKAAPKKAAAKKAAAKKKAAK